MRKCHHLHHGHRKMKCKRFNGQTISLRGRSFIFLFFIATILSLNVVKEFEHETLCSILSKSIPHVVQALEDDDKEESQEQHNVAVDSDSEKKIHDENLALENVNDRSKEVKEGVEGKEKEKNGKGDPIEISDDAIQDGFFDPIAPDPSCKTNSSQNAQIDDCWNPPESTMEKETVIIDATAMYGGDDPDSLDGDDDEDDDGTKKRMESGTKIKVVDKHWGSDENTLKMRDTLRNGGKGTSASFFEKKRPPIFLMPGLASTR